MPGRQWGLIGLIYSLGILVNTSLGLIGPLSGDLHTAIHASTEAVGVAFAMLFLPFMLGATFVGRAIDRIGIRNMILLGAAFTFAADLSDLAVNSFAWLAADNFVLGVGFITILVASQTALAKATSGKMQAGVLALFAAASGVGGTLGLWVSGSLADTSMWRLTFVVQGIAALCLGALAWFFLPPQLAAAAAVAHRGRLRDLAREYKAIRLVFAFSIITLLSVGIFAMWPLYLSALHGVSAGTIAKTAAVAQPAQILGCLGAGFLLARSVTPGKVVLMYLAGAVLSMPFLYSSTADLRAVTAAMVLLALAQGAWQALAFAMLPRLVVDKSHIGAATGLLHQTSSFAAFCSAPLLLALIKFPHANLVLIAVMISGWVVQALLMPVWGPTSESQPHPVREIA